MFGISGEHLLILVIILVLFGPKRIPQVGETLGRALKNFKDGLAGVKEAQYRKIEEEKAAQKDKKTDRTGTDAS